MIPKSPLGLFSFFFLSTLSLAGQSPFVQVAGMQFVWNGQPYHFLGTNFWYGMQLASAGEGGDRARLVRELDRLQALGVMNLRIMAAGEGPETEPWRVKPALQPRPGEYNAELLDGLDFLLAEMGKRGMTAVVCLNNFWHWSGGMAQYRSWAEGGTPIHYPDLLTNTGWLPYMLYTSGFYKNQVAREAFMAHLQVIIGRVNAYTGVAYRDDPTIMAWQLANEPRGMLRAKPFRRWIRQTAAFIKALDPNHLVCTGSEGNTHVPTGNHFRKDHRDKDIDYTTIHIWAQNWGWYDADQPEESYARALAKAENYLDRHSAWASQLGKPIVLEEFGISRDGNSHDTTSATTWRDQYYQAIFEKIANGAATGGPIAGVNFWAWGGEGRPREPQAIWQRGDAWIGDPPHEYQGWYSVYDTDASTLAIIQAYAAILAGITPR